MNPPRRKLNSSLAKGGVHKFAAGRETAHRSGAGAAGRFIKRRSRSRGLCRPSVNESGRNRGCPASPSSDRSGHAVLHQDASSMKKLPVVVFASLVRMPGRVGRDLRRAARSTSPGIIYAPRWRWRCAATGCLTAMPKRRNSPCPSVHSLMPYFAAGATWARTSARASTGGEARGVGRRFDAISCGRQARAQVGAADARRTSGRRFHGRHRSASG